jgi:hypothetical protein
MGVLAGHMGDGDVSDAAGIVVGAESAVGPGNACGGTDPHVTGNDPLTASADPKSSALVLPLSP